MTYTIYEKHARPAIRLAPEVGFEPTIRLGELTAQGCGRERRPELAPEVGFEPTTNRLTADRSTTELLRNLKLS
jgi:hypothetical protein